MLLEKGLKYQDDRAVLDEVRAIKRDNKLRFNKFVKDTTEQELNPDSIYDVQVKRLHEYKRQHLNALHILSLYNYIKENPNAPFTPRTFIFAAKAAPGYYIAKQIIRLIWSIAKLIDSDPAMKGKLKVIYLEDYRVTLSEILMPAADISETRALLTVEKNVYAPDEIIRVTVTGADSQDWVGIYAERAEPGSVNAITWQYVNGTSPVLSPLPPCRERGNMGFSCATTADIWSWPRRRSAS